MTTTTTSTPLGIWSKHSWRNLPISQSVIYPQPSPSSPNDTSPDPTKYKLRQTLDQVVDKLEKLPPLVSSVEIERLKASLAKVSSGEAFLLQGGDCAELFDYCNSTQISHRLSLLLSMSLILIWGLKLPVVRIARMGGQFAKPRSSPTETVVLPSGSSLTLPSFRGDNVNGFSTDDRTPDPERLLLAYFHSSATINHVRTLLSSGFASLPSHSTSDTPWSLELKHVRNPFLLEKYKEIVKSLSDALEFLKVVGAAGKGGERGGMDSADIYLSHEALMLEYEAALTRELPVPAFAKVDEDDENGFYCTSGHFIWIGDRTRSITGAHVEFFRGLRNPIGIKVGPSMQPEELVRLLDIVDPRKERGRVTLICRYGAGQVEKMLPGHIEAVKGSDHPVIWSCDPMHGNTISLGSIKTRPMTSIVSEISSSIRIHNSLGSRLGGVHLELTADIEEETGFSVTECMGGSMELGEEELGLRYQSFCDPRLNAEQSLDIAFLLSEQFEAVKRGREAGDRDFILEELSGSRAGSRVRQ